MNFYLEQDSFSSEWKHEYAINLNIKEIQIRKDKCCKRRNVLKRSVRKSILVKHFFQILEIKESKHSVFFVKFKFELLINHCMTIYIVCRNSQSLDLRLIFQIIFGIVQLLVIL